MATKLSIPSKEQKKRKLSSTQAALVDSDDDDSSFAPFLVVEPVDKDCPIKHSIFAIQKFASCAIGSVKSAKKLRNGTILVEVASQAQYRTAIALTKWVDVDVKVTEHRSLNTSKGVIRCREFRDCTDEELLEALQPEGVVSIQRIKINKNGNLEPTNTIILTFRLPSPPKFIRAAYMQIPVALYVPNPLRCYKCQRFGHSQTTCNRTPLCARCGKVGHDDKSCSAQPHCCNCKGDHVAYSKDCPEWQKQRKITQIKYERNITFPEAKRLYDQSSTPQKSYASAAAAAHSVVSTGTQTDVTWPSSSDTPITITATTTTSTLSSASQTEYSKDTDAPSVTPHSSHSSEPLTSTHKGNQQDVECQESSSSSSKGKMKNNKNTKNTKPYKGSDDPVKNFNRFGVLDGMEVDSSPS